ncbi:putative dsRNA-binding protein, partial [Puniceibacterium confluentis]
PKTALQEWAQGQKKPLPAYSVINRQGPDHAPRFTVEVTVLGLEPVRAEGRSRQEAEKAAAATLLQREGQS